MLIIVIIWAVLLVDHLSAFSQEKQLGRPNVVIILADDMGYGDIAALNKAARTETPHLDALTQEGITFTDAHSGGALCIPSRYGILTGRYHFRAPKNHGYMGYLRPLIEPQRETIGTLMQRAGYETACIGKWHLGLNWGLKDLGLPQIPEGKLKTVTNTDYRKKVNDGPFSLGFNYSFILPASLDMPPYTFIRNDQVVDPEVMLTADAYPKQKEGTTPVWDKKYTNGDDIYWERGVWWRNGEMSKSFKMEDCMDTIVSEGLSFINAHVRDKPEQPFLLYLPLTGPHTPWIVGEQFSGKAKMGKYGDFMLQVDDAVGRVNEMLSALKIAENTIVIFASDNGAHWAEEDVQVYNHQSSGGKRGQKGDIYDGGHHIPLIVKWPDKIKRPFQYHATVSLVDLMATFSEMVGQPVNKSYGEDSFSFYKVIAGASQVDTRDHIIYESAMGYLAIKKGDWKYIDFLGSGGFTAPGILKPVKDGPSGQLYDLKKDPLESDNLVLQFPERAKELQLLLNRYVEQGYSKME